MLREYFDASQKRPVATIPSLQVAPIVNRLEIVFQPFLLTITDQSRGENQAEGDPVGSHLKSSHKEFFIDRIYCAPVDDAHAAKGNFWFHCRS